MARVPSLRASDSEREEVAERLRHATAEGRLTTDELEERLEVLYTTRTYGELDTLVVDLPSPPRPAPRRTGTPARRRAGTLAAIALMLAVLGALGGAVHRSASVAAGRIPAVPPVPRIPSGHLRFAGPLVAAYPRLIVATAMVAVFGLLLIGVAVTRLMNQSRHTKDA